MYINRRVKLKRRRTILVNSLSTSIFNEEGLDWSDNPVKVWKIIIFKSMFPQWSKRPIKIGLWLQSSPSDLRVANRSTADICSLKGIVGPTDITFFVLTIRGGSFTRRKRVVGFSPHLCQIVGPLRMEIGSAQFLLTFGWFWTLGFILNLWSPTKKKKH